MKLIMESWRKYKNEMRDRYLPPGEDPSDPTPEQEEEHYRLQDEISAIIGSAHEQDMVQLPDGSVLRWEDFGDGDGQYLVGSADSVMDPNSIDSEVFYSDQELESYLMNKM